MTYLYVAMGGAFGSMLRYFMQSFIGRQMGGGFPYGTMLVNISGSVLMGLLIGGLSRTLPEHQQNIRLFFAVGVLGGYTTFSSFSLDAINLLEEGRMGAMSVYILASVACSLVGLLCGLYAVRMIPS